jgi:hypothetical protein
MKYAPSHESVLVPPLLDDKPFRSRGPHINDRALLRGEIQCGPHAVRKINVEDIDGPDWARLTEVLELKG